MSYRTKHRLIPTFYCVAIIIVSLGGIPCSLADEGESDRREVTRDQDDRGGERAGNGPRDGERDGSRVGDRFRSMRDRIQQGRPDGKPSDGRFSGRPGEGPGQRGPMAIPMFRVLDRNGDGRIDAGELDLAIVSLRTLDHNDDGQLTVQELLPAGPEQMGMRRPGMEQRPGMELGGRRPEGDRPGMSRGQMPSAEQMFKQLDRDGDGAISKDEAPGRMAENFDRVDQDGDEKISKKEMEVARQRMASMGQRDRQGRSESNEPAGGTRPRRPESEE